MEKQLIPGIMEQLKKKREELSIKYWGKPKLHKQHLKEVGIKMERERKAYQEKKRLMEIEAASKIS